MKFFLKSLQNIDNLLSYILSNNCKESDYLKNIFKGKQITCFDVGGNLGGYSGFINKNLNIKKLHIFEPSIQCFKYLKKNFNKKNINIINAAVSNNNKERFFYENEILSQSSLHLKKNNLNRNYNFNKKYKVKCLNLDTYCKKIKKNFNIDILKIDAEGEDLNVLKGSKNLLSEKKIRIIKVELLNSFYKQEQTSNILAIINYLASHKYFLDTIVKTKFQKNKLLMMDTYFRHFK